MDFYCRRRRGLGHAGGANRRGKLRRCGVPERNSWHGRWDAGAERRSIWAGSLRDDSRSAGSRSALSASPDLSNAECGFGYRSSIFNTPERDRYIILQVSFRCVTAGSRGRYPDLQKLFAPRPAIHLAEVRAAVREIRHRKAMLIVPGDEDARSAGSFFKNPMVPPSFFEELSARSESRAVCNCPAIPPGVFASCPRPGWSSTPDSPRATARVRPAFRGATPWRSSMAAAPPLPTSSP